MWTTPRCFYGRDALYKVGIWADADNSIQMNFIDPIGLYTDLCKLQNRYAFQGTYDFKTSQKDKTSKMPALFIDGKDMGTLDNLKVDEIKALAEPSPFGSGNKTVYDENVRKASEIKGNRIKLQMSFPQELRQMAPMGYKIGAKLYKLAIYEKDGFFAEHSDTLHGDNHIGTLLICLPVQHEGGAFILSDDGNELRLPFDEMVKDGKVPWVAFYTDVKHQVEVVKSGMRMTLQFDLLAVKTGSKEEDELGERLRSGYGSHESEDTYHFQNYNQEVFESTKKKLNTLLGIPEPEKTEEKPGEVASTSTTALKKRDRPDNDEPIEITTTKQTKEAPEDIEPESPKERKATPEKGETKPSEKGASDTTLASDEKAKGTSKHFEITSPRKAAATSTHAPPSSGKKARVATKAHKSGTKSSHKETDRSGKKEKGKKTSKQELPELDGVAIMLKRRYGAMSLSLERLKGSDNALYHALKDDYTVEAKSIILEQMTNDFDGSFEGQPIEVIALSGVREIEDTYSSDEETKFDEENKKHTPKKRVEKPPDRIQAKRNRSENDVKVKKVCLVSGFSPKSLLKIVSEDPSGWTGNEAMEGVNAYMHAALFIYPKNQSIVNPE